MGKPWRVGKLEWGGSGEGMGKGRPVYEQPGTRVDEDRTTRKGGIPSKRDLGERGISKGNWQGELTRGISKRS